MVCKNDSDRGARLWLVLGYPQTPCEHDGGDCHLCVCASKLQSLCLCVSAHPQGHVCVRVPSLLVEEHHASSVW